MQFDHAANQLRPEHFGMVVATLTGKLGVVELRRLERAINLQFYSL